MSEREMEMDWQAAEPTTRVPGDGEAAVGTETGTSHVLPFKGQHLRQLCKAKLSWNDSDIAAWIMKHTLPYLKHWKMICYDDTALDTTLQSLLSTQAKRESTRRKILHLCTKQEARLLSPAFIAILSAGPSTHVARTAAAIHLLCFSRIPEWTAAFILNEDGGYEIAIELLLQVAQDLWQKKEKSWFHPLLAIGANERLDTMASAAGDISQAGDGVKEGNRLHSSVKGSFNNETVFGSSRRVRFGSPMITEVHIKADRTEKSRAKLQDAESIDPPPMNDTRRVLDRTRARNERRREATKLKRFKTVGLLDQDANFATLRKRQEELKADGEKTSERATSKAARRAEEDAAKKAKLFKNGLRVTLRFTGHRRDVLREILSSGRQDANKRNEFAKSYPGYHGFTSAPEARKESVVMDFCDWDELEFQQAKERRAAWKRQRSVTEDDRAMDITSKGASDTTDQVMEGAVEDAVEPHDRDCVLGPGCERETMGEECMIREAFSKV